MASRIHFYKPYLSDTESSSDDDSSDTSGYTSEESLINLPGKNLPVETGQPDVYPFVGPIPGLPDLSKATTVKVSNNLGTNMEKRNDQDLSRNTTLFMINSRDRDTRVYKQPTFFTLRLPRVFKNVKTVSISQINLLNSFFNFSQANGNTFMYVYEEGRTAPVRIQIPDGTYNSTDVVTALTNALNATPIFAVITLSSFLNQFQNSGDYTIMFTTPGQYVYNSMTSTYDTNQTESDIVARYFQTSQTIGQTRFSYNECLVAFYYPIMKEMIIAQPLPVPFDIVNQSVPPGFLSWYDYIVFGFQGLGDPYITLIAQSISNQTMFDNYRTQNSFVNSLLNAYTCTYNSKQGRLMINAPSLNTSISTDLNTQYTNILNSLVTSNGFANIADFSNQYNNISFSNAAMIEFYNFIQTQFNSYFAVSYDSFSAEFYANSTNSLTLYDTLNRYGWNTTLNPLLPQFDSNTPVPQVSTFWKNITIPKTVATENTFISTLFVPEFDAGQLHFKDAGESVYGYTDISFALAPTTYIRTAFTTPCRQTISIMTLPRYINERSPGTEESYPFGSSIGQTPLLFDTHAPPNKYILCDVSGNINWNMFNVEQNMFYSKEYMRNGTQWIQYMTPQILAGSFVQSTNPSYGIYPASNDISINLYRPYIYFQMNAANYPIDPNAHYNVTFYVDTQSGNNFPAPITITWYKDRAGLMADIEQSLASNTIVANPIHYFKTQTYTDISSCTMVVDINNFQQTYFAVSVANGFTIPGSIGIRTFCVLTDTYGIFRQQTPLDQLALPYTYLPPLLNQSSPISALYVDPTKSIYDPSTIVLGYDISGISNNLLDYTINAGNGSYFDPLSIQNSYTALINNTSNYTYNGLDYQFIVKTNGSPQPAPTMSNWSLFFGSTSANIVQQNEVYDVIQGIYSRPYYTSSINSTLTYKPTEYTLANWMDPNIPNVIEEFLTPYIDGKLWTKISTTSAFIPAMNDPPIISDMSTSQVFEDMSGISGIGFFMPPGVIASLTNFVVKFAYTQPVYVPDSGFKFDRFASVGPANLGIGQYNNMIYVNQASSNVFTGDVLADVKTWDDWYYYNRRNIKIGIFPASQIHGMPTTTLSLSSAIYTMTLQKVIQVNNYQSKPGTLLTREPDWGTWYEYAINDSIGYNSIKWDISGVKYEDPDPAGYFPRFSVPADIFPTYYSGFSSYPGYFKTFPEIFNYSYLPRSYGISPSVGNAIEYPTLVSTATADIPNSYVAVPFYNNGTEYVPGSFFGLSYTRVPCLPSTNLTGASPYYGPPGPFAWTNDSVTSTFQLYNADQPTYKPYYFNTKISFNVIDNAYNPATDLSSFGYAQGISGEYQDTYLFLYKNDTSKEDLSDVSTVVGVQSRWAWGQESNTNYSYFDDNNGYNFLSYLYNIPVSQFVTEYAVHVRAYDPIAKFNTGLRFIGKNFTDFGTATLADIAGDVTALGPYSPITDISGSYYNWMLVNNNDSSEYNSTISTNNGYRLGAAGCYTHRYADTVINFSRAFSTTQSFGQRIGYAGIQFTMTDYQDALAQYMNFYSTVTSQISLFTSILSTATGLLNIYILDNYGNILPPNALPPRSQVTAPIPFQFLFSTYTAPPYSLLSDQWGLGYNLGFSMKDTFPPRTTIISETFIRIVQDYVYLRLNPEFNMNKMGVTNKENLSETRDPAAEDQKYFSKIILNDFASYCRTAIQRPVDFVPILGQLNTISCQLVDRTGMQINNADCEYDLVLEITELESKPVDGSTLLDTRADLNVIAHTK